MENISNQDINDTSERRSGSGVVIFLSILALILAIGAAYLLRENLSARYEAEAAKLKVNELSEERTELLAQLDELQAKYDKMAPEHQEMDSLLRLERRRVGQLRAQISGGGPLSGTQVNEYRQKIEELELQLEEFRQQIDVLLEENLALTGENAQIRSTLTQTTTRNQELEIKNQDLEQKVEKASILTISNLEFTALRERRRGDEPTDKARRTDKIRICFTINQNLVANTGNRDFFVRIIDPSNQVLANSPDNTLIFEAETIQYSIKRTINFQQESQDVCVIWDQDASFQKGYYNVVVFSEGNEVGYKLFQLD